MKMFPKITREMMHGMAAVIGGFVIHLTLGIGYSFGNLMTYAVSYMHLRVNSGVDYNNFIWVSSFTYVAHGLTMVFGGLLLRRVGPKLTCLTGCTVFSSGILLTYYTIDVSLVTVALTFGVMLGLGTGLSYAAPLASGMKWFPRRKGLINGIIVGGFGLGAILSTSIQTYFLNPDNISPDSDGYFTDDAILDRVPLVFLVMGLTYIIIEYIGCILISFPPNDAESEKLTTVDNEKEAETEQPNLDRLAVKDLNPKEVVRQKTFYVFWLVFFFLSIAISYVSAMNKAFGQTFISDDHFLAQVMSFAAIFNASGRILWGRIMDKTNFKISLRIISTIFAVLLSTLPLTKYMGKVGFAAWIWAIYLTFSGSFAIMPTATEKAFGSKHYAANYGLVFSCQTISGPLMAVINELMLDAIGFTGSFITMGGLILLSTGMSFFVPNGL